MIEGVHTVERPQPPACSWHLLHQVLKDWRPKDPAHGDWVAALKKLLKSMEVSVAAGTIR